MGGKDRCLAAFCYILMPNEPELEEQSGKRRVLIVEDEDLSRILLGRMLEDTYELYFAETGEEARSIISAQGMRLSLVLLHR